MMTTKCSGSSERYVKICMHQNNSFIHNGKLQK